MPLLFACLGLDAAPKSVHVVCMDPVIRGPMKRSSQSLVRMRPQAMDSSEHNQQKIRSHYRKHFMVILRSFSVRFKGKREFSIIMICAYLLVRNEPRHHDAFTSPHFPLPLGNKTIQQPSSNMGRGFSEEEINELKEQFELFDMMGDGECVCGMVSSFGCCGIEQLLVLKERHFPMIRPTEFIRPHIQS